MARFLVQRAELGAPELVFENWSRKGALGAAAARPSGTVDPAKTASAEEGPSERPVGPRESRPPVEDAGAEYDALRATALACSRCRLAEGRTQVVFSDGTPEGSVMVVGEAPGANEDRTGLPFVGAAGQLLDLLLASVDLSRRTSVYICNVIKCRPPGNRNPRADEIAACSPYLRRQIELVRPEVILAVGTFAAQFLSGSDRPIGELRRTVHSYEGTPLVVTYHPAALLRNPGWTRSMWEDLQVLRRVLDTGGRR